MLAIGLMSGTSLDGVDAALVDINNGQYQLKAFITLDYTLDLKERIKRNLKNDTSTVQEICSLNFEMGYEFSKAIRKLLQESQTDIRDVSFIASHGQTFWHNPNHMDGFYSSTLQLGEASIIAYEFNKTVVSDFRVMDMAAYGTGAPLIPFSEYLIFRSEKQNIALQNIGGIGNVTYLKKGCRLEDIIAFDTGPGNMLIDGAMRRLYNCDYDKDGETGSKGRIIKEILDELLDDEYFRTRPPKTTGREKYNEDFLTRVIAMAKGLRYHNEDIIATLTAFTAESIVRSCEDYLPPVDVMIIGGGGSYNKFLVNLIRSKAQFKVLTQEEYGYRSDAKEAVGFVVLGDMTLKHLPSNVPGATGAKDKVILGKIILPPRNEE